MANVDHFSLLKSEIPTFNKLGSMNGELRHFGQEVMRFHSIAGTLLENMKLDASSVDERYITHILARSVIEGFFWNAYIFDSSATRTARYEEFVNSFKRDYVKLCNEKIFPQKASVEPADPSWASLPAALDVKSMLAQLKNNYGDRLDYLYFVYRVASFDTHGKNLNAVFEHVFGKQCNFPFLELRFGFDLIANHYLVILQNLRTAGKSNNSARDFSSSLD